MGHDLSKEYIAAVIYKHLQGESLSGEEQLALDQWLDKAKINRNVFERLQDPSGLKAYLEQRMNETGIGLAFEAFQHALSADDNVAGDKAAAMVAPATVGPVGGRASMVVRIRARRWAAAAAIFLLVISAYLFLQHRNNGRQVLARTHMPAEIGPGRQGAVLTLANGRQVVLDSLGNGLVATQNGANLLLKDGKLAYTKGASTTDEVVFNTMTTPRGRQFQLTLPDGTKVWLNAASQLTYPTAFTGKDRSVSVTGEAYFEVAKNAAMPFKVTISQRTEVEVLGTSFNINAYTDEASMHTTLLEGSVRVIDAHDKVMLKPGEQASVNGNASMNVQRANIDKVMAWRNDLFNFEGASLTEVMNQISRWYDIEIIYEKGVPAFEFGGKIRRDLTLANLLKFLEGAGVHFRIEEGRRLVVLP